MAADAVSADVANQLTTCERQEGPMSGGQGVDRGAGVGTMRRGLSRLVQQRSCPRSCCAAARPSPRSTFPSTVSSRMPATASRSCWCAIEVPRTTLTRSSCSRSPAAARVPPLFLTACSRSCGARRSWSMGTSIPCSTRWTWSPACPAAASPHLAYALYGERLFDEYPQRFLKRNVQGELIQRILNPTNWSRLASDGYGRSELAADYYDEILFGGATFNDLIPLGAPVAVVTGTDLSTGARFEFSQDTFDLLCSDLGSVRLARAAATSSAVPVVLSPVTYRNYGGKCDAMLPVWVQDVANREHAARPAGRALLRYRDFKALEDSENRPYLHIVDGAVSDNLGLRGMLEAFEQLEASPTFQREMRFSELRHIVVIAVNSRSAPATDWDRKPAPPGIVSQLIQASSVPIDHFSFESVELLRDIAARWADRRELAIARRVDAGQSRTEAEASVPTDHIRCDRRQLRRDRRSIGAARIHGDADDLLLARGIHRSAARIGRPASAQLAPLSDPAPAHCRAREAATGRVRDANRALTSGVGPSRPFPPSYPRALIRIEPPPEPPQSEGGG